ncbi:MAG: response regulator [Deltaproteobacteria bacterium]|nr:response regulator [Deltaproteobacteria bacterium]
MNAPRKLRALVVDDSEVSRRVLSALLHTSEVEVVAEAVTGEEALRLYGLYKPDFVLLDVVLPGIDGVTTARFLRHQDQEARILMCSGTLNRYKVEECRSIGVDDFLIKPYNRTSFKAFLSSVVRRHALPQKVA